MFIAMNICLPAEVISSITKHELKFLYIKHIPNGAILFHRELQSRTGSLNFEIYILGVASYCLDPIDVLSERGA
jgi:hypothetical protein